MWNPHAPLASWSRGCAKHFRPIVSLSYSRGAASAPLHQVDLRQQNSHMNKTWQIASHNSPGNLFKISCSSIGVMHIICPINNLRVQQWWYRWPSNLQKHNLDVAIVPRIHDAPALPSRIVSHWAPLGKLIRANADTYPWALVSVSLSYIDRSIASSVRLADRKVEWIMGYLTRVTIEFAWLRGDWQLHDGIQTVVCLSELGGKYRGFETDRGSRVPDSKWSMAGCSVLCTIVKCCVCWRKLKCWSESRVEEADKESEKDPEVINHLDLLGQYRMMVQQTILRASSTWTTL